MRTERGGQRPDAHAPVALEGLEIVERHDPVRTDAVGQRNSEDARIGRAAGGNGGPRHPRQAFVAEAHHAVADPAVALEAERRRAVAPGEREPEKRREECHWTEQEPHERRHEGPGDRDPEPPLSRDAAGGNGPVRLVDGVHVPVEPVVHGLARTANERATQKHAEQDEPRAPAQCRSRGHQPACERPHRRKPGDWLQKLQHVRRARHPPHEANATRCCPRRHCPIRNAVA